MNAQRVTTAVIFMGLLSVIGVTVFFAITFPAAAKITVLGVMVLMVVGVVMLLWVLAESIKDKFF